MEKKGLKPASYSVIFIALALAITIVLNLFVSSLPDSVMKTDLSANRLFTLSDTTKKIAAGLAEDVDLVLLHSENGADVTLSQMMRRYGELSDRIRVSYVDPAAHPSYASDLGLTGAAEGDVIVMSATRKKLIPRSSIYTVNYNEKTYEYNTQYAGEQQLTSAIDYVTATELPVLYVLTGHEETELTETLKAEIGAQNIEVKELNLLTSGGKIPEDASALLLYAPVKDLSRKEADEIIRYLNGGGRACILTAFTASPLTQFERVLAEYGMSLTEGLILEGDSSHYYNTVLTLIPDLGEHDIISALESSRPVAMMPNSRGILTGEGRKGISYTSLLRTTDASFAKTPVDGKISSGVKEPGDPEGPFDVGVYVTEHTGSGDAALVVFSSSLMLDEELTGSYNLVNRPLFENALTDLCGRRAGTIRIAPKNTEASYNTIPSSESTKWIAVWVILIPAAFLACGFWVWMRRRKK